MIFPISFLRFPLACAEPGYLLPYFGPRLIIRQIMGRQSGCRAAGSVRVQMHYVDQQSTSCPDQIQRCLQKGSWTRQVRVRQH